MPAGQLVDALGHGRGEQNRLAALRRHRDDGLDVLDEAHLEHLVRLVEDQGADVVEYQRATTAQVQGPTRRGHHDIDSPPQRVDLMTCGSAPVDGDQSGSESTPVSVERLRDLERQLTGGDEDQRGRCLPALTDVESLEDRQREGRGLARAGRRLSEQVPARDEHRDRRRLDRGCLFVPEGRQSAEQLRAQTQLGEGGIGTFAL